MDFFKCRNLVSDTDFFLLVSEMPEYQGNRPNGKTHIVSGKACLAGKVEVLKSLGRSS
jgi:hypothetical protein